MFWGILCIVICVVCITILIQSFIVRGILATFNDDLMEICLLISITTAFIAVGLLANYHKEIINDAIEHYINGDYQIIKKTINGEVVDSYYKLIPTDYD